MRQISITKVRYGRDPTDFANHDVIVDIPDEAYPIINTLFTWGFEEEAMAMPISIYPWTAHNASRAVNLLYDFIAEEYRDLISTVRAQFNDIWTNWFEYHDEKCGYIGDIFLLIN